MIIKLILKPHLGTRRNVCMASRYPSDFSTPPTYVQLNMQCGATGFQQGEANEGFFLPRSALTVS